jgi:hypothetical protein
MHAARSLAEKLQAGKARVTASLLSPMDFLKMKIPQLRTRSCQKQVFAPTWRQGRQPTRANRVQIWGHHSGPSSRKMPYQLQVWFHENENLPSYPEKREQLPVECLFLLSTVVVGKSEMVSFGITRSRFAFTPPPTRSPRIQICYSQSHRPPTPKCLSLPLIWSH